MVPRYMVPIDETWPVEETEMLIIGTGIAGLYTALKAADLFGRVTVFTKRLASESNTQHAQGGIAAAMDRGDSPSLHWQDTIKAGAGLNNPLAVEVLVKEGPSRVEELILLGTAFDKIEGGELALTQEGAHSRRRILHASGDATGEEIRRALWEHCQRRSAIDVYENVQMIDILLNSQGQCVGVLAFSKIKGIFIQRAKVTVLASGGNGQLFRNSTNPEVTTGDGIAAAYRAGVEVMDLEFVQFHPTALTMPGKPAFLISEAVRGEGGKLINARGERFMPQYHELAELAPRNVVSLAIWKEMNDSNKPHVYLDISDFGDGFEHRFPTIYKTCRNYELNVPNEPIPVAPAAHYLMGGIRTDLWGRTNIPRLYACGEAACNGVHGANRLASNSLLDGLVFGARIVEVSYIWLNRPFDPVIKPGKRNDAAFEFWPQGPEGNGAQSLAREIQNIMWDNVGLWRSEESLTTATQQLLSIDLSRAAKGHPLRALEALNMHILGNLTAQAALLRTESRGAHYRVDYQEAREEWLRRIVFSL